MLPRGPVGAPARNPRHRPSRQPADSTTVRAACLLPLHAADARIDTPSRARPGRERYVSARPRPRSRSRADEGRTVTLGFAPSTDAQWPPAGATARLLEPAEWAAGGIPLLRSPREVVSGLHDRHRPAPSTAVVAVLDHEERVTASASVTRGTGAADGWKFRNSLLDQLRRVVPHDLRRRTPVRTAVVLYCREGEEEWTEEDGAWMWGLRDACTLHGLRCGAYITLTRSGWQVLGEVRRGRSPSLAPRAAASGQQDITARQGPLQQIRTMLNTSDAYRHAAVG